MEDKTAEYAAIFDENIKVHGTNFEAGIAMEECAELIQAISKVRRYGFVGKYRDNLLEEIADVDIVLTELMMMFDIVPDEFFDIRDRKVQRIKKRLEENFLMKKFKEMNPGICIVNGCECHKKD